jgi:hypothetical protein
MTATQVQLRRGSTADHATFTGAEGEMTVDTDQWLLIVHDGTTPGGFAAATSVYVDAEILEAAKATDWGRKGADIASATNTDLGAATGDLVDVTGTTTITAITLAEGRQRVVRFTGTLTLTNGASLVLPGGADIVTAAGDFAIFRGYAAGVVRCVGYFAATGLERERAYVDLASAATTAIGAVASRHVRITGTTGITSFGTAAAGTWRRVRFAGALLLTHNGTSLILPGAANITTAAGDTLTAVSLGSGNWAVTDYQRADGTPVIRASTTEVLTGTDAAKPVTADALAALWEKGSNVTAAATISLGEGGYFTVTGNTGISDVDFATAKDGRIAFLRFTGTPLITHNATTLMIAGGANWQVAAGDMAIVIQDAGDNVVLIPFLASGRALTHPTASDTAAGIVELATAAETLAGTDATRALTPAGVAGNKSLSTSGYYQFPGGLIIQWGLVATGTPASVTFPIAFPSACRSVTTTMSAAPSTDLVQAAAAAFVTASGCSIYPRYRNNGGGGVAGESTYWMAIGY